MKKALFLMGLILVSIYGNAQISSLKGQQLKFAVSAIEIDRAPDADDSLFVPISVREELIRSGKISMTSEGDTLFVSLLAQRHSSNSSVGRHGKYGELALSIVSKNGRATATARKIISVNDGELYYSVVQELSKIAADRFVFINNQK